MMKPDILILNPEIPDFVHYPDDFDLIYTKLDSKFAIIGCGMRGIYLKQKCSSTHDFKQ